MTRRMISDDQEVYRVVVRRRKSVCNPDWIPGELDLYTLTDEEYDTSYGPYSKVGTAKGVQAHEAYKSAHAAKSGKARTDYQWDVVDTWIEKAVEIAWERV